MMFVHGFYRSTPVRRPAARRPRSTWMVGPARLSAVVWLMGVPETEAVRCDPRVERDEREPSRPYRDPLL